MIYIIIGIVSVNIILNIILLFKKSNNDTVERLGKLETDLTKELGEFKFNFSRTINEDFKIILDFKDARFDKDYEDVNIVLIDLL